MLTIFSLASRMGAYDEWGRRSRVLLAILSSERAIIRAMTASAAGEEITLQQFSVLGVLSRLGSATMSRLSKELRVTPPNITGVVDRLERKELVKRETSAGDRRKKEIRLTAKGAGLYERVREGYSESLQESLNALTAEEQETLSQLLRKLVKEIVRREEEASRRPKRS
jgi:MarR family transcriptional regulator, organic hydroperoxide resistance regulator